MLHLTQLPRIQHSDNSNEQCVTSGFCHEVNEKSSDHNSNQTCNLPACSAVPQPTVPQCSPTFFRETINYHHYSQLFLTLHSWGVTEKLKTYSYFMQLHAGQCHSPHSKFHDCTGESCLWHLTSPDVNPG